MATDFIVGGLLLGSVSVNILALGAFWVTPSLRTTANRFVINLLIVNLVSCFILAPPLLFNAVITSSSTSAAAAVSSTSITSVSNEEGTTTIIENEETTIINATIVTPVECKNETTNEAIECFEVKEDNYIITKIVSDELIEEEEKLSLREIRSWGLDLAAALGALSVLLVVADTWCAVTDPLRYHSRVSELKAWSLIAGTWCLGIVFGIASALRGNYNNDSSDINQHHTITTITNDVYNTIFSYTYFIIVILVPFGMVCAMYWRIFTEARDSGQRMRQNGSSPLLQSALNLAAVSAATTTTAAASTTTTTIITNQQQQSGGLTMKIDKQITISDNNDMINENYHHTPNHLQHHQSPPIIKHHTPKPNIVFNQLNNKHQNILLTLTKSTSDDKLHRNISSRQLFSDDLNLLKKSSLHTTSAVIGRPSATSVVVLNELRHVHSTPNLEKTLRIESLQRHHEVLQLPTVNVPPKALSYMTSIRHRLSNASSLFKYREESRAARISVLVVIMFMVSYLPYGILVLMQGHNEFLMASDQALLATFTVVMANLSSPFIFAYRNKRVRRGVRRLLGIDKKTNQRMKKINNFNNTFNNNSNCSNNCNSGSNKSNNNFLTIKRTNNNHCKNSSCKYLTPQSAITNSVNGSYLMDIEKYSTPTSSPVHHTGATSPLTTTTIMFNPHKKQIHIDVEDVDDIISNNLYTEKKSILKRVCDTSRKWGCTCATTSCNSYSEQTEV